MPPRITGLRPMKSDSQPNRIKVGDAMSSAIPMMALDVSRSSLDTCCRKYSAVNCPLYQTTPCPISTMQAIPTNFALELRKASLHGFLVIPPLALICSKIGVSCSCRRSEEHTSELQSHLNLVCRLLLEKKKAPHSYRPYSL